MGVFGALVFMELRHGAELPAHWRLPRAVIWLGICLQLILEGLAWAILPIIATGAHVGGFVAGFATCAAVGGPGLRREPLEPFVLAGNGLFAVALLASLGSAAVAWREGPDLGRRADLLLSREDAPAGALNNLAWLIATGEHPGQADLDAALRLAERAADQTGRSDPNVLDTLAEVYFQRGERAAAVAVIEEAIHLAPRERYFLEQRERFLGRRAPDDRPDPPAPAQPGPRLTPEESGPLDPSQHELPV
jgi:tetratricopeptide (TPR) repeat protein